MGRVHDGPAHIHLGSQVKDQIRAECAREIEYGLSVGHVGDFKVDPGFQGQVQVFPLSGREVVDHSDIIPACDQGVGQMRTDESCASGDKCFHEHPY